MIANNRQRKDKFLWSELGEGDPVHVRELEDEHAEARFVVSEIERLVEQGESRDEIAVFYRTNAQSRVLEDMLVRYGVGYQVIGGTRFYERAEIKDALAYLTLLVNPADTVAFGRGGELAAARHRATRRRDGWWATRTRSGSRSGTWRPSPSPFPASRPPRSRRWAASCP